MSDLQATADRVEIEALRGEFTDAVMMCDYDRLASLFTPDGAVRIPLGNIEAAGREEIRAMASGGRLSRTTSCRPRTRPRRVAAPHPWRKP
jgi:ketosteroid isomerase-like protein